MGNFWKRILDWLYSAPKPSTESKNPDIGQLDPQEIARQLGVQEEARRLGEAGMPASDSKLLSGGEQRIIQHLEKARLDYIDWANLRLAVLNEDLSRLDVTPVVNRALQADKEFERKASALLAPRQITVSQLAERSASRQQELAEFKQRNGLTRNAHDQLPWFVRFGALFVFVIIEGLANAWLFATGLSGGLIQGFVLAAIIAGLNVVLASFWGIQARNLYHRKWSRKVCGLFACLAALGFMTGVGFAVGHYRDALIAEADDPARVALTTLTHSFFSLGDMTSWLLFVVSLLFGLFAFIDGMKWDDPYPGYGKLSRATAQDREDFQEALTEVRVELESLKEETLGQLDKDTEAAKAMLTQQESLIQAKVTAQSRLETAIHNAQLCMETLINQFRTENEMYRNGLPRPVYFSTMPTLKTVRQPDFKIKENRKKLLEQDALVQQLAMQLQPVRAAVQAAFNREFDRLQPLDSTLTTTPPLTPPETVSI